MVNDPRFFELIFEYRGTVEEQEGKVGIEDEKNSEPIKIEISGCFDDVTNCCRASEDLFLISRFVKREDLCEDGKQKQSNCGVPGPFFYSNFVKCENRENYEKNEGYSYIPESLELSTQPIKCKKETDEDDTDTKNNILIHIPQDAILIAKPVNFKTTFNNSNPRNETTKKLDTLNIHSVVHVGNKSHRCTYCNRSFKRNDHLTTHLRKHTGEKPFHCDECDAKFAYRSVLNHHKLVHSGEKPFECKYCGARFTKKFNLKSHISRIHHTARLEPMEKKFICDVCNSKFFRYSTLKLHDRRHSSDKPFGCSHCEKKFKYKHVLNKHLRTHDMKSSSCKDKCEIC